MTKRQTYMMTKREAVQWIKMELAKEIRLRLAEVPDHVADAPDPAMVQRWWQKTARGVAEKIWPEERSLGEQGDGK